LQRPTTVFATAVTLALALGLVLVLARVTPSTASNLMLLGNGPADDSTILNTFIWTDQIAHAEVAPDSRRAGCEDAALASQCLFTYTLNRQIVPAEATHLLLRVKSKAWVMGHTLATSYALIYGGSVQEGVISNHFFHTEEMEGPANVFNGERRRVNFNNALVPIVDGKVVIGIGKQLQGNSLVEVTIYLTGYLKPAAN